MDAVVWSSRSKDTPLSQFWDTRHILGNAGDDGDPPKLKLDGWGGKKFSLLCVWCELAKDQGKKRKEKTETLEVFE